MLKLRKTRVRQILDLADPGDRASRIADLSLGALILLNVIAVILESIPSVRAVVGHGFWIFELCSVAIFSVEYGLRVWSCVEHGERRPLRRRLRYVFTPMALIDLAAILPFFLALGGVDLRFLRALRLLRLLKLTRYSKSLGLLLDVARQEARPIAASMFVLLLLLVISSSAAYLAEHKAQPDHFGSIPQAMWWAVITMTTVGYGDVTPVTMIGKVLAAVIGVIGIGMVALPAGLLASGFTSLLHRDPADGNPLPRHRLMPGAKGLTGHVARMQLHAELAMREELSGRAEAPVPATNRSETCPHCGGHLEDVEEKPRKTA